MSIHPLVSLFPTQILSTTLEAEGVCLDLEQLKELMALVVKWDKQKCRVIVDKVWHGLLDFSQCLF